MIPGADGLSHIVPIVFPGAQEKELGVERTREQSGGSWGEQGMGQQ